MNTAEANIKYVGWILHCVFFCGFAFVGAIAGLFTFYALFALAIGVGIGIILSLSVKVVDKRSGNLYPKAAKICFWGYLTGFALIAGFLRNLLFGKIF
jgi:hypothetical protein